jgi:hypothetical protein
MPFGEGEWGVSKEMVGRLVFIVCLAAALPAVAGEMKPEEARRFVVGKLFSFTCFEGTSGAGRISGDGSVAGVIRLQQATPARYVTLPPGTLHVKGDAVCASLRGLPFEPCFDLVQTDARSFRGSVAGMSFAYCQFTRRGGRAELVRTTTVRHRDANMAASEHP